MKAAHKDNGTWQYWNGEPRPQQGQEGLFELPRNAADIYHPNKLRTFGLTVVQPAEVPEGKRVVEVAAAPIDIDGKPHEAVTLEDIPEPEPEPEASPIEKLTAFLAANPDVAALIG